MTCQRCEAMEKALRQCVNQLYNQGGGISTYTHEANMLTVAEAETALKMPHVHPLPSSVNEALNSGDGSYKP